MRVCQLETVASWTNQYFTEAILVNLMNRFAKSDWIVWNLILFRFPQLFLTQQRCSSRCSKHQPKLQQQTEQKTVSVSVTSDAEPM